MKKISIVVPAFTDTITMVRLKPALDKAIEEKK